jgi:predicted Zn finger-like uncharacterized protein
LPAGLLSRVDVKLSCPSCGAKYSIADEKVHDRLAKIRCRKCSATIIIDGKVTPASVYTSDAGGSHAAEADDGGGGGGGGGPAPGQYSVDFGDNDQRTMSADDIAQAYRRGELTRETFVWADGMGDWTAIGDVPELAGRLDAGGAPAAPQQQPRAAARSGSGRGSAHDLFGGIETAGSEADITTSAPQPAAPQIATGARNESSVLFSLSALTASAGPSPSAPTKPSSSMVDNKVDDSGLIDLKALTSSVANQGPMSPLGLGTAPLGMAAPLGGITAPAISTDDHMMPRQQGSKTGLYIAAAMIVVGALIAGAIVFSSSKAPPAGEASAVTTPAVTATPAAPTPEPKKEELAAPPSTGTAEAASAPSASAIAKASVPKSSGSKSSGGGSKAKSSSGTSAGAEKPAPSPPAASEPAEKPKPKPKSSACNCPPGDLMCAMKCAAGH